jgi:hypothetical protein
VFLIFASRHDTVARVLADRGQARGAMLVTPRDLSTTGWRDSLGHGGSGTAAVDGRVVSTREVRGVLTRLTAVDEHELTHIVPADRAYVAQEMTAFLLSWLCGLSCPILNRPTPGCLAGPPWRPEQWVHQAARLGIPVRPARRTVPPACGPGSPVVTRSADQPKVWARRPVTITIVGDRWFGAADPALARHARRLATAAGVDLVAVHFTGPGCDARLVAADVWPDVASPEIGDAVLAYLEDGRRC